MRASPKQRAHARADALSDRFGIETHERLLNGFARVAIALFGAGSELLVDSGEAPRHGRMKLDQTGFAARAAAATAVLARFARAAATDLYVLTQAALLDRNRQCHEGQIDCRPQRAILVVDGVRVRHAIRELRAIELGAK